MNALEFQYRLIIKAIGDIYPFATIGDYYNYTIRRMYNRSLYELSVKLI